MLTKQTRDEKSGRVAATYEGKNVLVTGGFGFVNVNNAGGQRNGQLVARFQF